MSRNSADAKRRRALTLSNQGATRAEQNRCPKCGRKSALRREYDGAWVDIWCYWREKGKCDYYKGYYIDDPKPEASHA